MGERALGSFAGEVRNHDETNTDTLRGAPMQNILIDYEMLPTTWFYVSSLLIIGIFFKFQRFFSIRNLDLVGLLTFSPGLLLVAYGQTAWGYAWVFFIGALFLVRLLVDQILVRRPLLEPNLERQRPDLHGNRARRLPSWPT